MKPWLDDGDVRLHHGDAIETLAALPAESVDCCITSPPYYGLRDYGVDGQIGLEDTPEAFIARLVDVFRGVRRVLRPEGTCWVNLGDSYASSPPGNTDTNSSGLNGAQGSRYAERLLSKDARATRPRPDGVKPKDLLMMPARLALALQADGWWLRSDIIWHKPNPMPESVTDRPTSAHEHIFLLTKQPRYWYDAEAIREKGTVPEGAPRNYSAANKGRASTRNDGDRGIVLQTGYRNARNVWTIATQPTPDAHFATFPEELVRRCLVAGCPEQVCRECGEPRRRIVEREPMEIVPGPGRLAKQQQQGAKAATAVGGTMVKPPTTTTLGWSDCGHGAYRPGVVLDPFMGSGTTARVARHHGRNAVGIELNEAYLRIAANRLRQLSLMGGAA